MGKVFAYFGVVTTSLALICIFNDVESKMFTQPWPVRKGLNIISCLAFENAKELEKKVCQVAYSKYEADGIRYNWIVGINLCRNSRDMKESVQWNNTMRTSERYELYEDAWLGIHVTEENNDDKYLCNAIGPAYRKSIQILLKFYIAEENKTNTILCTCPANNQTVLVTKQGNETAGSAPDESNRKNGIEWMITAIILLALISSAIFLWCYCRRCMGNRSANNHLSEENLHNVSGNACDHAEPDQEHTICDPRPNDGCQHDGQLDADFTSGVTISEL